MTQNIRRSQFVTTYGPGAILESRDGPRLIPSADIGLFRPNGLHPESYEILDQRVTVGLLGGAHVFKLPSNAEARKGEASDVYLTRSFPEWRLCLNWAGHGRTHSILYAGRYCPECGASSARMRGQPFRTEAIRFVAACPQGHLDDVEWYRVIHHDSETCRRKSGFRWTGGGGSLSRIWLECPGCGKRENLGDAYGNTWPCSGRLPEKEPLGSLPLRYGCNLPARITQRQAANLRLPELKTLFSIPPRYTELSNTLQLKVIHSFLAIKKGQVSEVEFREALDSLVDQGLLERARVTEILQFSWEEIQQAIRAVLSKISTRYHDLIQEEFQALVDGSLNGVPPRKEKKPGSPIIFEIDPNLKTVLQLAGGRKLRVTPVLHLRTVTVQVGYRREVDTQNPSPPQTVSFTSDDSEKWYPGVQHLGEGIFIMLDDDEGWHFGLSGEEPGRWAGALANPTGYPEFVFRSDTVEELHPVFVWWHTLAHSLIRSVSIEAGYSTAAIRERIYLETSNGRARGGILLYATQPGSEGTMGGLIALTRYFDTIMKRSQGSIESCSSDPLCADAKFAPGLYNGAACYGCLLLSETSCEHRNMWLDRNLLRDNKP